MRVLAGRLRSILNLTPPKPPASFRRAASFAEASQAASASPDLHVVVLWGVDYNNPEAAFPACYGVLESDDITLN